MKTYASVDEYLDNFSVETRKRLEDIRRIIKSELPDETVEKISYGIPTYNLKRNLIHFGGYDRHISLYPGSRVISELKDDLEGYKTSKGTIQFPNDKPIPIDLLKKIIVQAKLLNTQ